MEETIRILLARRIRALRRKRGWSQEGLADYSGLHRTYIGSIERAERNFTVDTLEKLAVAFGISVYELVDIPNCALEETGTEIS